MKIPLTVSKTSIDKAPSAGDETSGSLYKNFLGVRDEILRHKWLKSEEAGEDIGFEAALVDWMENHLDDEADASASS